MSDERFGGYVETPPAADATVEYHGIDGRFVAHRSGDSICFESTERIRIDAERSDPTWLICAPLDSFRRRDMEPVPGMCAEIQLSVWTRDDGVRCQYISRIRTHAIQPLA